VAGFVSEWVAGFILECMAGFVGIRSHTLGFIGCEQVVPAPADDAGTKLRDTLCALLISKVEMHNCQAAPSEAKPRVINNVLQTD